MYRRVYIISRRGCRRPYWGWNGASDLRDHPSSVSPEIRQSSGRFDRVTSSRSHMADPLLSRRQKTRAHCTPEGVLMKRLWKTSVVLWCLLAASLAVLVSLPAFSADTAVENKPVGSDVQQKQWLEGLSLVGTGKIDKGAGRHRQPQYGRRARRTGHSCPDLAVGFWQKRQGPARAGQEGLRQIRLLDEGRYRRPPATQALRGISMAHSVADDPDAFVKEPWVLKAVEDAVQAAKDTKPRASGTRPPASTCDCRTSTRSTRATARLSSDARTTSAWR